LCVSDYQLTSVDQGQLFDDFLDGDLLNRTGAVSKDLEHGYIRQPLRNLSDWKQVCLPMVAELSEECSHDESQVCSAPVLVLLILSDHSTG
jgi:hypothetical protein